jgi:hypothetical protein
MNFRRTHRLVAESKNDYATSQHFCELFAEDINSLYLLSFLLTADHDKAEQCFVAGLDDCVRDDSSVFGEWSHTWALRVIVRNAIRTLAPHVCSTPQGPAEFQAAGKANLARSKSEDAPFASVLALGDFERFVYVLSVLEKYSDEDCAAFLGISQQEVREGRVRALEQIVSSSREISVPRNDGLTAGTN